MSLLLGPGPDAHAPEVVRLRARIVEDFYGEPIESWEDPDRLPLPGARIQDRTSTETTTGQRLVITTGKVLFVPGEHDIVAEDRIEVDGTAEFEVDGDPSVRRGLATPVYTSAKLRTHRRGGAQ